MRRDDKAREQANGHAREEDVQAYEPPRVEVIGSVEALTAGGGTQSSDSDSFFT
jgi:hypothetical protein